MKADTISCYCISKHVRGIAESLHAYITRARLTACAGAYFREKYDNS